VTHKTNAGSFEPMRHAHPSALRAYTGAGVENRFPEIAAVHTRTALEVLGERWPGAEARVRARLQPVVREALEGAARSDFLPAMVDLDVAISIHAELGPEVARRVAREVLRRSLTGSVLGGLVRSASALFGLTPPGLLRWAGRGYGHVCRDCGELAVTSTEEGLVRLALTGMPEGLAAASYLESMGGALEAFLDVCQVEGRVDVELRPGGAAFNLHWRKPRSTPRARTP
jgi:hypothetical protein